jgi:hypothetical protein
MRSARKSLVSAAAAVGASALLLSGCTVSGGGWYGGTNAKNAKVTAGFNFMCDYGQDPPLITGEMSFVDRRTKPTKSFVALLNDCSNNVFTGTTSWHGTYKPRPKGTGGTFDATFTDTGASGPSKGDVLNITLRGGTYDGYNFNEALDGGNITFVQD